MAVSNTSQYISNVKSLISNNIGTLRGINPNRGKGLYSKSGDIRDDELMKNEGKTRYGIDSSSLVSVDEDFNIIGNMGGTPKIGQSTSLYMNENNKTTFLDDVGGLNGFTNNQDETDPDTRIVKGAKFRNEVFNNDNYANGASFFSAPSEYETYSVNDETKSKMADESIKRVDYRPYSKGSLNYSDDNEGLVSPSNYSDNRAVHYTHYDEKNVAQKKETHVVNEFDSFDFNDGIGNSSTIITDGSSTLVKKTNNLFKAGKIGSLISRFSTGADFKGNEEPTAKTGYGMSRGRNLLKVQPTQHNGYTNPYCRVWTAHYQYSKFSDAIRPFVQENANTIEKLQRTYDGFRPNSGNTYLSENTTILTGTNLPLIAPTTEKDDIKKCMFSIENLAWKGYRDGKLEESQKGPFGGRIMWFPPYNLSFDENVNVNWQSNEFIGRGEKIYTYANTDRSGNLKFSILVDHPSVVDMFMKDDDDVMAKERDNEQKLLRFFAGCEPIEISEKYVPVSSVTRTVASGKTVPEPEPELEAITVCFPVFYPNNYSAVDYQKNPNPQKQVQSHSAGEVGAKYWSHPVRSKIFENDEQAIINGVNYIYKNYESYQDDEKKIGEKFNNSERYWQDYKWSDQILGSEQEYRDNVDYGLNTHLFSDWINYFDKSASGITSWCDSKYFDEIKSAYETAVQVIGFDAGVKVVPLEYLVQQIGSSDPRQDLFTLISEVSSIGKKGSSGDSKSSEIIQAKDYTVGEIKLFGGASSHGKEYWNTQLCTDRWKTILEYLIQKGILSNGEVTNLCDWNAGTKITKVETIKIKDGKKNFSSVWGSVSLPTAKAGRCAAIVVKFNPREKAGKPSPLTTEKIYSSDTTTTIDGVTRRTIVKGYTDTVVGSGELVKSGQTTVTVESKLVKVERFHPQNEYQFFKNLEKDDSVAYKSLIRKLKYFNPAFHSITPEGFNARLTFLHQCTRQGPTFSTSSGEKGSAERLVIGAGNLAFGEAPYCILRIGDFYNTKIVINSISISYDVDGIHWDTNPEGIGMQPMMADVNINFNFIGGSDLAGPISKLQNAVTANYYANTSVYDKNSDKYNAEFDNKGFKK